MNWWGWLYLTIMISLVIHLALRLNQSDQKQITTQPQIIQERIIVVPKEKIPDTMRFKFTP